MALLNFKKRFAKDVEQGIKRQTIRASRKFPIEAGETLFLYESIRTKSARRLGTVLCKSATVITIDLDIDNHVEIILGGTPLVYEEKEDLAIKDGFNNLNELFFFIRDTHGLPFEGQLIKW